MWLVVMVIGKDRGKVGMKGVDKAESGWVLSLKRIGSVYNFITLALMGVIKHAYSNCFLRLGIIKINK